MRPCPGRSRSSAAGCRARRRRRAAARRTPGIRARARARRAARGSAPRPGPASKRARRNSSRSVVAGGYAESSPSTLAFRSARVAAIVPGRHRAVCLLISWRASAILCTSSGPSANRRVRIAAKDWASGKSCDRPAAAVHLDRLVEDPLDGRGGGDLDRLDLGVRALVADGVHQPGGLEHQQPKLLDPHPRLGDPLADHALAGQRLAERHPLHGAPAHHLDRALGDADGAHAVVDPAGAEAGLGDREPVALLADEVRGRAPGRRGTGSRRGRRARGRRSRRPPCPRMHADPGSVARDEDHRLLAVPVGVRVGLAHHDEDLGRRAHRAGDPPLAPVDDVLVAVPPDRGADVRGVGGGHVGLGHREGRADLPRRAAA